MEYTANIPSDDGIIKDINGVPIGHDCVFRPYTPGQPVTLEPKSYKEIIPALVEAQKEIRGIRKDSNNPFFKSKYAPLETIFEVLLPALNNHGLFLTQDATSNAIEGGFQVNVQTTIFHISGESLDSGLLSMYFSGTKFPTPQDIGSAVTYAKRYSVCSFLGIAADEDDDAESISRSRPEQAQKKTGKVAKREKTPAETLYAYMVKKGYGVDKVLPATSSMLGRELSPTEFKALTEEEVNVVKNMIEETSPAD